MKWETSLWDAGKILLALLVFTFAAGVGAAYGQPGSSAGSDEPVGRALQEVRTVEMTVEPAGEPTPALRYTLLPGVLEQASGNAAPLYYQAMQQFKQWEEDPVTRIRQWLQAPLEELPVKQAQRVLREDAAALRLVELAARHERCDWELPIRSEGFGLVLPSIGMYRTLAQLVALKARVQIAEGRYEDAVETLQTGMAMARHQAQGPTLIHAMVGVAIADQMLDQVQSLVQQPNAPNLYWALSALPSPLIDPRPAMRYEGAFLYFEFPELRGVARGGVGPGGEAAGEELVHAMEAASQLAASQLAWTDALTPEERRLQTTLGAMALYPQAKRSLVERGWAMEEVEAMPVKEVIARYFLGRYEYWRDEIAKWWSLPYPQGHEGLDRVDARLNEERFAAPVGNPFVALLPSFRRTYFEPARLERRVAAMRCVEAVRMYAAEHGGKPPASLGEIAAVPVPADPVTGEEFGYEAEGNTFVLTAAAPPGQSAREGLRYQVTIEP